MKVHTESTIKITLILEEDEARWLKTVMQNPIGVDLAGENPKDQSYRRKFFETLKAGFIGGKNE